MFDVYHTNVDGAGPMRLGIPTLNEARAYADEQQRRSDERAYPLPDGTLVFNPYLYEYVVFRAGRDGAVYRTRAAR